MVSERVDIAAAVNATGVVLSDQEMDPSAHHFEAHVLTNNPPNFIEPVNVEEPKVGMCFPSTDDAYKFYCKYAGKLGFNPRKSHNKKNKVGFITRVSFCCSREGFWVSDKQQVYPRPSSRVGCKAEMSCLLQKDGTFMIVSFQANHNHDLISSPMKHMLKVNQSISAAQKSHMNDADKAGLSLTATLDLMSTENGGIENLGFLSKDYKNYIYHKRRLATGKGDAGAIMEYFEKMHTKDAVGKRYSHLCQKFREVAACASENEKLYTYANGCLAELLVNLEKMMETLCLNKSGEDSNVHGETSTTRREQIDLVTPVGVKRKATVEILKGRFKDPLEKRMPKAKLKSLKTSKSEKNVVQDVQSLYHEARENQTQEQIFNEYDGLAKSSMVPHNHLTENI